VGIVVLPHLAEIHAEVVALEPVPVVRRRRNDGENSHGEVDGDRGQPDGETAQGHAEGIAPHVDEPQERAERDQVLASERARDEETRE